MSIIKGNTMNSVRRDYQNKFIYLLLIGVCLLAFGNGLWNNFITIDDIPIIVKGSLIRDFWGSMSTLQIQNIVYTHLYTLFGLHPFSFHMLSVFLHIINTVLVYHGAKLLFRQKIAVIASVLFTLHPINSETVAWISASPYLYNAAAMLTVLYLYIVYKKTQNTKYFVATLCVFIASLLFVRTVWLLLTPLMLFVIDASFLQKKISLAGDKKLFLFGIPMVLYGGFMMMPDSQARFAMYQTGVEVNQQLLTPFLESAPYTVSTMFQLYLIPHPLQFFYDGNLITASYYILMYVFTFGYGAGVLFLWKRDRKATGLLVLPVLLMLPVLSPVRFTWYMAERYLYLGSAFYGMFVAYLLTCAEERFSLKHFSTVCAILLSIVFAAQTVLRVGDFKDSKQLATATLATTPQSYNAQTMMAQIYIDEKQIDQAMKLYNTILKKQPETILPAHNLGHLYIKYGTPSDDLLPPLTSTRSSDLRAFADTYFAQQKYELAFFYYHQVTVLKPQEPHAQERMAYILVWNGQYSRAESILHTLATTHPERFNTWYVLFFSKLKQKQYPEAYEYVTKALAINPSHAEALQYKKLLDEQAIRNNK